MALDENLTPETGSSQRQTRLNTSIPAVLSADFHCVIASKKEQYTK
jgi:hypothetical protein